LQEEHRSRLLAKHLTLSGDPRPNKFCHAHAIISGAHTLAAESRAILAWLGVRIDDPDNGCWLPENTAAKTRMPRRLMSAVPHSRIHRYNYYFWLSQIISTTLKSQNQLRQALNMIEARLQAGTPPQYVMLPKGTGLPA